MFYGAPWCSSVNMIGFPVVPDVPVTFFCNVSDGSRIGSFHAVTGFCVIYVVVVVVGDSQHCCWDSWSRRLL